MDVNSLYDTMSMVLAVAILLNHMFFPLFSLVLNPLVVVMDTLQYRELFSIYFSVILAYTVMASLTNGTLFKAFSLKAGFVVFSIVVTSCCPQFTDGTASMSPVILIIAAVLTGALEATLFRSYFSTAVNMGTARYKATYRAAILTFSIAGQLLLHKLTASLYPSLYLSFDQASEPMQNPHAITVFVHVFFKELLILVFPSTFARLSIVNTPSGGRVFTTRQPSTIMAAEAPQRITAFYYLYFAGLLVVSSELVRDISSFVLHPISWIESMYYKFKQSQEAWEQLRFPGRFLRLLVTGRLGLLKTLLRKTRAEFDILFAVSVLQYGSFLIVLMAGLFGLAALLQGALAEP